MNQRSDYSAHVHALFEELESRHNRGEFVVDYNRLQKYEAFTQIFLTRETKDGAVVLKIDLVNDIASHYGGLREDKALGTTDSWRNILSNKLSAVFRYEAKDIVDIWTIAKNRRFDWVSVTREAKTQEAAVEPVIIYNILKSFPVDALSTIKWVEPVDSAMFKNDLDQIAEDIFRGRENRPG